MDIASVFPDTTSVAAGGAGLTLMGLTDGKKQPRQDVGTRRKTVKGEFKPK